MPTKPPTHAQLRRAKHPQQPRRRLSPSARGYGRRWERARAAYLQAHPLCARCAGMGRVTAATVVDHVVPHQGDQALFWDAANWQPLCPPCHAAKSASEDGWMGNPRR